MYVASHTEQEEGSQEGKAEIPGEGLSDLKTIDTEDDEGSGCIEGSSGHLEEDCLVEEALVGTNGSLPVIRVTSERHQTGTNSRIRVPTWKRAATGGKDKNRSRFHRVHFG